ncbi:type II 3-dehydroquinate dehydratase [Streptomyces sp. NPDC059740]|uniref:type II 3-dehydroquinate dehydratase n=1 Tax=Streptomyces sp. NPDC059740 TaxID=3346926 RepID=UPI0036576938
MSPRTILVLNGPNLNLLGQREPELYGTATLADAEHLCVRAAAPHSVTIDFRQSNHEGRLIDWVHESRTSHAAVVINPAGYSHTSVALADALATLDGKPVLEVHLTAIHRREAFRHHSYVSVVADAVITGCGVQGYALAVERACTLIGATA